MSGAARTLAELALDRAATVRAVRLDEGDARWLAAAGLFAGQTVRVLRRAVLGGPLHVRVASGGDFAVDRSLAAQIELNSESEPAPVETVGGATSKAEGS